MTLNGILFMLISWAVILGLLGYSMARTLSSKHRDQLEEMSQDEAGDKP